MFLKNYVSTAFPEDKKQLFSLQSVGRETEKMRQLNEGQMIDINQTFLEYNELLRRREEQIFLEAEHRRFIQNINKEAEGIKTEIQKIEKSKITTTEKGRLFLLKKMKSFIKYNQKNAKYHLLPDSAITMQVDGVEVEEDENVEENVEKNEDNFLDSSQLLIDE